MAGVAGTQEKVAGGLRPELSVSARSLLCHAESHGRNMRQRPF